MLICKILHSISKTWGLRTNDIFNKFNKKNKEADMELKSLILGLSFTLGIFAIKSGVGLNYFLSQKKNLKSRLIFFSFYSLIYFAIFMLSSWFLRKIAIASYFDSMQSILKSGMLIHFIMAGLLLLWGVLFLKGKHGHNLELKNGDSGGFQKKEKYSLGWLVLVIPCPVCMTTIFFSVGFLVAFFPDSGYWPILLAYNGFILIALLSIIITNFLQSKSGQSPEFILGSAMIMIASYFLLSMILIPQFGDVDKIYRLAMYKGEKEVINIANILYFYGIMLTFFGFGFFIMQQKIRRVTYWK
ncbi:DUF2162 [Candidatus Magnetomoraceae bacterium gMMP-15]